MALNNEELLRKATLSLDDFGGGGEAPLSIEQVAKFYRVAIDAQAMLPDVRTVMSNSNKWQESKLDFGSRIMRAGVEGVRLVDAYDATTAGTGRAKPTTGIIEISTSLIRGEVPITDEVLEDQVERAGFSDTLTTLIAERVGRDIEELLINGDTAVVGTDAYLGLLDGWFEVAKDGTGANDYDATADAQDYQAIFSTLLASLADRFKKDKANMRFYVPARLEEKYRDNLTARGTPLGDQMLEGERPLKYQGVLIKPVSILDIAAGAPDTSEILLSHRLNLLAGYRRMVKFETYRDPREGVTSFIVTCRVDAEIEHIPATALAYSVNVEP